MKKIAFVTSLEDPNLIKDDQLVFDPLRDLGYEAVPYIWDHGDEGLQSFDAIIFRSCWNYHRKYEQFLAWMKKVTELKVPILNPMPVNLWNLHKSYLQDLEKQGARIPKTRWISRDQELSLDSIKSVVEGIGSKQLVIKPAVSLNGQETYLCESRDVAQVYSRVREIQKERDVLIQEFIPEIQTSGEVSLIFFNRDFSHAVRKTPAPNEFRIHSEYGGRREAINPDPRLIEETSKLLQMVEGTLLFSRVDVVETQKGPILIELEILDPMLFLGTAEGAPQRFAKAIAKALT